MKNIPYDFYLWGCISLAFLVPTFLLLRQHKTSPSRLTKVMMWLFLFNVFIAAIYSLPLLFNSDRAFVTILYGVGDILLYLNLGLHSYLLWYVFGIKRYLKNYLILYAPFVLLALALVYLTQSAYRSAPSNRFGIVDGFIDFPESTLLMRSIEIVLLLPFFLFGVYLIVQGLHAKGKLRQNFLCYGLLYGGVGGTVIFADIVGDTYSQQDLLVTMAGVFASFAVIRLLIGSLHTKLPS